MYLCNNTNTSAGIKTRIKFILCNTYCIYYMYLYTLYLLRSEVVIESINSLSKCLLRSWIKGPGGHFFPFVYN